jgi:hypothetical protein
MTAKQEQIFEGEPVRKVVLAVTGSADQTHPGKIYKRGEEVVLLVRGTVSKIEFGEKGEELARIHKVKAGEVFVLDEFEALTLVAEARERDRKLLDEIMGRAPIDGFDEAAGAE